MSKYPEIKIEEMSLLPGPLYTLIEKYNKEIDHFRKIDRLIKAMEWALKWHTVLVVSDLLREKEIPDKIKVLLATGLRTPSLVIMKIKVILNEQHKCFWQLD